MTTVQQWVRYTREWLHIEAFTWSLPVVRLELRWLYPTIRHKRLLFACDVCVDAGAEFQLTCPAMLIHRAKRRGSFAVGPTGYQTLSSERQASQTEVEQRIE
jgi:hypothetical protein